MGRSTRILLVLLSSTYLTSIGVSVFNVALPSVEHGLDASPSELQWVLSGYALLFGTVLIPAGRAGDMFGRRALFLVGTLVFTAASAVAGLSSDASVLAVARLVQGFGAGIAGPQTLGILRAHFAGEARARAMGWFGTVVGLAFISGPLVGGTIIALAGENGGGWRWIFWVNVPLGVLTAALAMWWIPSDSSAEQDRTAPRGLDLVGAGLLTVAVASLLLPFTQPESLLMWGLLPFAALVGVVWVRWESSYRRRGLTPMVDLDLFRVRQFSAGTLITSLYLLGTTNVWVLVALYMQDGLGHSAFASGMLALPSACMTIMASRVVGRHVYRIGRLLVALGLVSLLFGLAASATVIWLHVSEWWLLASLSLVGLAQGSVILPTQTLALDVVSDEYASTSVGIMQTGQRIGAAIGVTLVTTVVFSSLQVWGWALAAIAGLASVGVVAGVALALAIREWRTYRRVLLSDRAVCDAAR